MSSNLPNVNPANYIGTRSINPPQQFFMMRAPTTSDYQNFVLGDEWLDRSVSPPDWYKLASKANNIAIWLNISSSGGGSLSTLTGDDAVPVIPVAANINLQGGGSGAIAFTSGGPGQMNAQVLVDGASITIVGNQLFAAGGSNPIQTINTIGPDGVGNFTISPGPNIVISPGINSISISSTGNISWIEVAINTLMSINTGYIVNGGAPLTMTLPAVFPQGATIEIIDKNLNGFSVQASAGDIVTWNGFTSSAGGGWTTATLGCSLRLLAVTANDRWDVLQGNGNFVSF